MSNLSETKNYEGLFISCLLNKPEFINKVADKIKIEHLSDEYYKIIYQKMLEISNFTIPIIAKSLNGIVKVKELLAIQNEILILSELTFDSYCYVILECFKERKSEEILKNSNIDDIPRLLEEVKSLVYFEPVEVNESDEFLKNVDERYQGIKDSRCIETGFFNVDESINGFRKSELIIIGGRPASGKTTFAMNIAYNMAKEKKNVLFCSLEMGIIELHERLNKSLTKINNYRQMSQEDYNKVARISRAIKEKLSLFIYDKAGMTIEDIFYQAKKYYKDKKLDIVFVDHLSILKSSKSFKSRYEEISYLSARLKVLARELDVPVVCLCQLNRALESRDIKAPTMSDLRDSGSIEQDADIISFVYRPEYHLKDKEPDNKDSKEHNAWEFEMDKVKGKAQFIIAKNRRGCDGRFKFGFDGANYTFYERND